MNDLMNKLPISEIIDALLALDPMIFLIGLFLPLFPLNAGFNILFANMTHPVLRLFLIAAWPVCGIFIYQTYTPEIPEWIAVWALVTAFLYAFRLLAMREVGRWVALFAVSAWACLWLPLIKGDNNIALYAVWIGTPLAILSFLVYGLEKRFGAAYTELYGGLAQTIPRFSGVLVVTVLAITATPIFPTFFTMLHILMASTPLIAVTLVFIWLVWSWAGMRLIQGLVVGDASDNEVDDLSKVTTWLFAVLMILLTAAGLATGGL